MEQTVFCPIRRKRVALTPEEGVRQQLIKLLVEHKGYPAGLLAAEYSIKLGKKSFRCDIVAFDRNFTPVAIFECKAPNVKLDTSVMEQAVRYNMVLGAKYLVITNGITAFACRLGVGEKGCEYVTDIPSYFEANGE